MEKFLISTISIDDLAGRLVTELRKVFQSSSINESPDPYKESRLFGDKAVAAYLGCTIQTIGKLRKDGQIPYHKFGRKYYYYASEIDTAFKVETRRFGELRGNRRK